MQSAGVTEVDLFAGVVRINCVELKFGDVKGSEELQAIGSDLAFELGLLIGERVVLLKMGI